MPIHFLHIGYTRKGIYTVESLFITIKEPDFSVTMHSKILKDFYAKYLQKSEVKNLWNGRDPKSADGVGCICCRQIRICQEQKQSFEFRLDLEIVVSALPKAEHFRWNDCLFWSLSAPFGSIKTSMELLSVCSCLTQAPLLSFHLQHSLLRRLFYFSLLFHQSHYDYQERVTTENKASSHFNFGMAYTFPGWHKPLIFIGKQSSLLLGNITMLTSMSVWSVKLSWKDLCCRLPSIHLSPRITSLLKWSVCKHIPWMFKWSY